MEVNKAVSSLEKLLVINLAKVEDMLAKVVVSLVKAAGSSAKVVGSLGKAVATLVNLVFRVAVNTARVAEFLGVSSVPVKHQGVMYLMVNLAQAMLRAVKFLVENTARVVHTPITELGVTKTSRKKKKRRYERT